LVICSKGEVDVAEKSEGTSAQPVEETRRQERANRILDAAAELMLRWGYNKTTIDDISRQAGVAKGTIYLHWKTRDELFEALITREGAALLDDLKQRLAADPAGSTLHGMLKHSALALMKRPLLKALVLQDVDVIGKLAHSESSRILVMEKLTGLQVYLEFLREQGLVRTDLSPRAEMHLLSVIFLGFFLVPPLLPDDLALTDEEMADLMAETVRSTLEIDRPVAAEQDRAAGENFMGYLNRFTAVVQDQLQQEVGGDPAREKENPK
jgi:AcrR family transcriptional regulator